MKKYIDSHLRMACVLSLAAMAGASLPAARSGSRSGQDAAGPPAPVKEQVTFLYVNDIERAAKFYGGTLGLRSTFDRDWVKIYSISPSSSVGLVKGTEGMLRPASEKPVMVSMVVDDVDGWYAHLKSRGVSIPKPPQNNAKAPVRGFTFNDPEGYTLEVFAWLTK